MSPFLAHANQELEKIMHLLLAVVLLCVPLCASAQWEPPQDPDPIGILREARADARAGRFDDALAKRLWFHHHAVEHQPSLYGVRLGPALTSWHDLARAYPPALEKLRETRDAAAAQVLDNEEGLVQAFADMTAINERLGEDNRTVAIFQRLDENAPDVARQVYNRAQPALIKAEEYLLCGKYLDAARAYFHLRQRRQFSLEYAESEMNPDIRRSLREGFELSFLEDVATLIAILVITEQMDEAKTLAERVRSESKHPDRDLKIDLALAGKLPKR